MTKSTNYFQKLRILTFLMIVSLVVTTLIVIILYPENVGKNGVISWIITLTLLILYSLFCYYLPFIGSKEPFAEGIRLGTQSGILSGLLWTLHLSIDHFIRLADPWSSAVTITAMVLILSIYCWTAYKTMFRRQHVVAALLSSLWSAMFSILILFVCSWVVTFLFMHSIEKNLLEDADYLVSGMINISDYTIHHNIESAGIRLLEAPFLSLVVAGAGIIYYRITHRSST